MLGAARRRHPDVIRSLAPLFGLVGLAVFLFARNWAGWVDPLVDFGRELYVPWRLSEGQVLYRDIAYLDGPFSPYWNALWFGIFGVALRTLEMANIVVIAGTSALIFGLLKRLVRSDGPRLFGGRIVATVGVAVFLCVFAVNLIGIAGNMNWLAPYSHGITHGVALSLLSIWFFARHLERGRTLDLSLAGFGLGLSALTKPEVFAAASLAIGVGMLASLRTPPPGSTPPLRRLVILFGSTVVPGIGAVVLLAQAMPIPDAIAGAAGGWSHLVTSEVRSLYFYRWIMGIDEPVENLLQMAVAAGVWAAVLLPALIGSIVVSNQVLRDRLAIALPLAVVAVAPFAAGWYEWEGVFRPIVIFLAVTTTIAAVKMWQRPSEEGAPRAILELCLSVLGLALLAKIFLKPWMAGYGFALLVPGALVLVYALLHTVPVAIRRRSGDGRLFGRAALALLGLVSLGCLLESERSSTAKTVVVGTEGDRFWAEPKRRPRVAVNLTDWVERRLPPHATLLVMPEGVMVNYLTRRINPTRHLNFMPPELEVFGENEILEDLKANPPDFVALVHRDTSEYGLALFGTDYGQNLLDWAHKRYVQVVQVGSAPLRPSWEQRDGPIGWEVRGHRTRSRNSRAGS